MISLGSYKLDVEEMLLSRDGEKVILEPKVLEVLLYFVKNKARYISMKELHENIWQKRIVSDAAVRRIIGKLRVLFNDDHKAPNYIKSRKKLGYKLICSVSDDNEVLNNTRTITHSAPLIDKKLIVNSTITDNKFIIQKLVFLIFLLAILSLTLIELDSNHEKTLNSTTITSQTQEKLKSLTRGLAISKDNKYLAFSGKVEGKSGYQIWLKHRNHHDFIPITEQAHLPLGLAFSENNQRLFFSDLIEGDSSLYQVNLSGSANYETKKLLKNYYRIGDVFTSKNNNTVYFSGQKKQHQPMSIYSYSLASKEIQKITSSTQINQQDIKGAITPNGKLLAVYRHFENENRNEVRIINLANHNVIYHHQQSNQLYDLQWLDNNNFLLLDDDRLIKINYKTDTIEELIDETHNLSNIVVKDTKHIIAITQGTSKKIFLERNLPFDSWTTKSISTVDPFIYFLNFQPEDNNKLALFYKNHKTKLAKLNTENNELTPYLETEQELDVVASSYAYSLELLTVNNRFSLLNTKNKSLVYISSGDDFIEDASFSSDEQNVLFSVKSFNQWQVKNYNIETKAVTSLFSGFRYVRPYGENYILATAKGELFFYDNQSKEKIALKHQLCTEPNVNWFVNDNYIYWSSHDMVTTTFNQLNISDVNKPIKTQKTFDYDKVRPSFAIKHDGSSIIYALREYENPDMVLLTIY